MEPLHVIEGSAPCGAAAPLAITLMEFLDRVAIAVTMAEVNVAAGIARESLLAISIIAGVG